MKKLTRERNSNIELLRIICMLGIIIGHCWNPVMGGGANYLGSNNIYIFYFIISMSSCAVNLFVLISGYFMSQTNTRNLIKPILLLVQVILFKLGGFGIKMLFGVSFSGIEFIKCFVPNNYFVLLYIVLYVISPYINIVIQRLNLIQWKQMLVMILFLFSVFPTMVDFAGEIMGMELIGLSTIGLYGSQWGYTIINFMMMYILGAYIHINERKWEIGRIIFGIGVCGIILTLWSRLNDYTGYFTEKSAVEYCNPIIILLAILIFEFASSFLEKHNEIVNVLAKGAFSVFLFQNEIIKYLPMKNIMEGNEIVIVIKLLLVAGSIYLCGWGIGGIYRLFENKLELILKKICKNFELQYPQ